MRRAPGNSHTCGMMNGVSIAEQHTKVSAFIKRWQDHGDEKQDTQRFWIDLLQNVLGVKDALESTKFEYPTVSGGFIDVLCPEARFLVEQKSSKIDLDKPEERQGTMVTPVQQALRYADALPFSMKPAVLCTCNFKRFRFYDLDKDPRATGEPADEFTLEDAVRVRREQGIGSKGVQDMIRTWRNRGFIEERTNEQLNSYIKLKYKKDGTDIK